MSSGAISVGKFLGGPTTMTKAQAAALEGLRRSGPKVQELWMDTRGWGPTFMTMLACILKGWVREGDTGAYHLTEKGERVIHHYWPTALDRWGSSMEPDDYRR
jgi:hypothetical protein